MSNLELCCESPIQRTTAIYLRATADIQIAFLRLATQLKLISVCRLMIAGIMGFVLCMLHGL